MAKLLGKLHTQIGDVAKRGEALSKDQSEARTWQKERFEVQDARVTAVEQRVNETHKEQVAALNFLKVCGLGILALSIVTATFLLLSVLGVVTW